MDVFAHALWGYVVFRKRALTKLAVLATVMPDVLSFGIYLTMLFFSGHFIFGKPDVYTIPHYVTFLYNVTHSLFIAGVFGVFVYLKYKKYLILIAGWVMHIVIDIFSHTEDFFPTHFLYPLSDFHLSFVSWANKWFMLTNYSALLVVYSSLAFKRIKRSKNNDD